MITTRAGTKADLGPINDLYNHYIRTSPATFDIDEKTMAWREEWFAKLDGARYRLFVAEVDGRVAGFASSGRFRDKAAYDTSVEVSVYARHDCTGMGVGAAVYVALFDALAAQDVHRAYAGITLPNDASIALHARFGFRQVAHFTEQGRKFGRYWDVAWFEKSLASTSR